MRLLRIILQSLIAVTLVGVGAWLLSCLCHRAEVSIEMRSPTAGVAEVFWRKPVQSYVATRSHAVRVPISDQFRIITIPLPSPWISDIRIDPINSPGSIIIRSITLRRSFSTVTLQGTELAKALRPLHQVSQITVVDEGIGILAKGDDPQLELHLSLRPVVQMIGSAVMILCLVFALGVGGARTPRGRLLMKDWAADWSARGLHRSFIMFFFVLFAILVAFKMHGSSMHAWYRHVPGLFKSHEKPLFGEPRGIRSDEWLVQTPGIISEARLPEAFAWHNPTIGADAAPMLMGLPTRHVSTILRPQYWGFFLLDLERGFSWFWSYRIVSCLLGVYLLLYCLTRGRPGLSLVGSLWCFYSPFVQWWLSATVPELIGNLSLGFYSIVSLLTSTTPLGIWVSALGVLIFGVSFALQLYPPFQIPLAWFGVALLVSTMCSPVARRKAKAMFRVRLVALATASLCSMLAIASYLLATRETLSSISRTAYPGVRSLSGGGFELARFMSGLAALLMGEQSYPDSLGNICEASSFLMIWPLALLCLLTARPRKVFSATVPIAAYLIAMSSYVLLGWPPFLAKVTLLNQVPSGRAMIGIGLANVCFSVMLLARFGSLPRKGHAVLVLGVLVGGAGWVSLMKSGYGDFFTTPELAVCGVVLLAILLPFIFQKRAAFGFAIVTLSLATAATINPVVTGLRPLLNNKLTDAVRLLPFRLQSEPVLVFGGFVVPQLFEASGLQVITGSKFVPDLEFWKKLDPDGRHTEIYNRYAHVVFEPKPDPSNSEMILNQADLVTVLAAPCGPDLERAGVNFMILPQASVALDLSCLQKVPSELEKHGLAIYVRSSAAPQLLG